MISATDFLGAAAKIANRDYRLVEMCTFVAVVYFIISFSLSYLVEGAAAAYRDRQIAISYWRLAISRTANLQPINNSQSRNAMAMIEFKNVSKW